MFEPPQRSNGPENHKEKQDHASGEAGDTDPRERAFAVGCPPPEFGIGDQRETGIERGRIERIAHQRPCLEMGRKIVDDQRPAFPAVGGPVEPAVGRDDDHFLARSDSMHSGVRLGKRLPDALPARAGVIAPEHSVASRGP